MNNYINKLSSWYIEQQNGLSGQLVYDQIYHISINRVDPNQTAFAIAT